MNNPGVTMLWISMLLFTVEHFSEWCVVMQWAYEFLLIAYQICEVMPLTSSLLMNGAGDLLCLTTCDGS